MLFKAFSCVLFTVCISLSLPINSPSVGSICQEPNLQRALCSSSFVLRAKVLSPHRSNNDMAELWEAGVYKLEIIQLFAFRPGGNNKVCVRWPYVYLKAPTSAVTGISTSLRQPLDLDVEYLLTGRRFDASTGKLSMGLCDWKKKWNEMSSAEKGKLTSGQCSQSKI